MNEKRKEYLLNYQKEKLKRVPLALPIEGDCLTHAKLKAAADEAGESMRGYIIKAIEMRMNGGDKYGIE